VADKHLFQKEIRAGTGIAYSQPACSPDSASAATPVTTRRDAPDAPAARASVLAPVLDFLRRHAPFDQMAPAHLDYLAKHLKLGFYASGEVITGPEDGPAGTFYLIKQGRVRGEADTDSEPRASEEGAWELVTGECFPIGALMSRRPVRIRQRAVEDTFCFELARDEFDKLLVQSPVFHDFCSRRLANLLDKALRSMQQSLATQVSGDASLSAPLERLVRRDPVTCAPDTPLRAALKTMQDERIGSIVVARAGEPLGMFTLHDVLSRVVNTGIDLEAPIERVMSPRPVALSPQASAYEAAVVMARHGFGHLCVVEDGQLVGVVSERDLFSLQRIGLVNLSRSITHAHDVATLARFGRDVHRLIDQMLVQGASVTQLSQITTLLNDHLTRRVIELCLAEAGAPARAFTWLAFGSEGRKEQTLKTDQDNGILFAPAAGESTEQARAVLLPLARRINEALAAVGFPLCPGNIMAGNPKCCLSLEEWKERFTRWIDQGTPEHLLNASIYFDFRVLWGEEAPAEELRAYVLALIERTPRFLRQLAENALRNQPPLGLMRDFVVESKGEHANTIDLKLRGAMPFVDGARLVALAHGIAETNTSVRLCSAAKAAAVDDAEAQAWCDAYDFIQLLRMRHHQQQETAGRPLDNYINPDSLNELDRRILKEAFRQARKLQTQLALEYNLYGRV
jgi:CBS domain-containing protein